MFPVPLKRETWCPQAIWRTKFAFLAQLRNGNFIAWGDKNAGADISFVKTDLESVGVEANPLKLRNVGYNNMSISRVMQDPI